MIRTQKITPCLWFDANAEEAANHYVSIFNDSRLLTVTRYGDIGPGPKGSVMTVEFALEGQRFLALNGGPMFKFTEAISLMVDCDSQQEVDRLWSRLTDGGQESQCGWLKDRFGLSWQLVPTAFSELMRKGDEAASQRMMQAMLKMKKLDLAALERAWAG